MNSTDESYVCCISVSQSVSTDNIAWYNNM